MQRNDVQVSIEFSIHIQQYSQNRTRPRQKSVANVRWTKTKWWLSVQFWLLHSAAFTHNFFQCEQKINSRRDNADNFSLFKITERQIDCYFGCFPPFPCELIKKYRRSQMRHMEFNWLDWFSWADYRVNNREKWWLLNGMQKTHKWKLKKIKKILL